LKFAGAKDLLQKSFRFTSLTELSNNTWQREMDFCQIPFQSQFGNSQKRACYKTVTTVKKQSKATVPWLNKSIFG